MKKVEELKKIQEEKVRSQIVVIRGNLNTSATFEQQITLNFTATRAIIRGLTYKATVAETGVYELYSDLSNSYIHSFFDGTSVVPNSNIQFTGFSNNIFKFYVYETLGTLSTAAKGIMCLTIEFFP